MLLSSWAWDCFLQSWAARKPIAANSLTHCCVKAASPKTKAKLPFASASPAIPPLTCVKSLQGANGHQRPRFRDR